MKSKYGKIVKLTKNLEFVEKFNTVREAAHSVGSWASNIYDAIRNGNQSHNFYWWSEKDYNDYLKDQKEAEKPVEPYIKEDMIQVNFLISGKVESFYIPVFRNVVEYR